MYKRQTFFTIPVNNGASGNPPNIVGLPPIASVPISQFLAGPGPIYSGIPINGNADPLSLDSGRAVTGGYSGTGQGIGFGEGMGDCGCPETFETFSQPVETNSYDSCDVYAEDIPLAQTGETVQPFAVASDSPGELDDTVSQEGMLEGQTLDESLEAIPASAAGPATIEEDSETGDFEPGDEDDDDQAADSRSDLGHAENLRKPSFLKRFSNWLLDQQA